MKISRFKYASFILLILFSFFFSCRKSSTSTILLHKAQNIVESNPSEALLLLDSISNPEKMDKEDYMEYIVAKVQTKYKTYQDISNDTLIFDAQSYFEQKSNNKKAALANFYAAALFKERHKYDKALENFLKAEQYAKLAKDNLLRAKCLDNIGFLYFEQNIMDAAILRYQDALNIYNKQNDTELYKLQTINSIGSAYFILNQFDSSLLYFHKGLELANQTNNSTNITTFNHKLGVAYREKGDYNKSTEYLYKALAKTSNSADSLRVYLNLSKVFVNKKEQDSVKYYTGLIKNRLSEITNNHTLKSVYGALSDYHKSIGDYEQALYYSNLQKQVNEKILKANNSDNLLSTESKYKLYIQRQEQKAEKRQLLLIIQTIVIILVIVIAYLIDIKKRHKDRQRLIENRRLKVENLLLRQQHDNHLYIENIYKNFILKWSKIENKANQSGIDEEQQIDLPVYTEVKSMTDELKSQTNKQLINLAKNYLHSHKEVGEKAVRVLTDQELTLMILCFFEYSKVAIAVILDIKLEKLDLEERKLRIKTRLRNAGMDEQDIDFILYS